MENYAPQTNHFEMSFVLVSLIRFLLDIYRGLNALVSLLCFEYCKKLNSFLLNSSFFQHFSLCFYTLFLFLFFNGMSYFIVTIKVKSKWAIINLVIFWNFHSPT